jgi:hypothetical protein
VREYGTCTNDANNVSLRIGDESSAPMHDMKWSWDHCGEHPDFPAYLEGLKKGQEDE